MNAFTSSAFFGIVLSVAAFGVGVWLQNKLKTPLANPLVIGIALCIAVLNVFHIPYENFNVGGQLITMLLIPATAVLAMTIYNQIDTLKRYFLPVVLGCLVGSLTSIGSVVALCRAFGLDDALVASMLPKSVTSAIAMGISEEKGGMVSVTVAAVVVTGVFGAMFAPLLIKLFRVKNPVAAGVAIGTSSHAAGTSKAIELGEVQGAMSSIAIGVAGLITTILALFF